VGSKWHSAKGMGQRADDRGRRSERKKLRRREVGKVGRQTKR